MLVILTQDALTNLQNLQNVFDDKVYNTCTYLQEKGQIASRLHMINWDENKGKVTINLEDYDSDKSGYTFPVEWLFMPWEGTTQAIDDLCAMIEAKQKAAELAKAQALEANREKQEKAEYERLAKIYGYPAESQG